MHEDYIGEAKQAEMPTMAESKVEKIRSVLLRIERLLRPVLSQAVDGGKGFTSNPTPVNRSKLLKDLDDVLEYASELEARITL